MSIDYTVERGHDLGEKGTSLGLKQDTNRVKRGQNRSKKGARFGLPFHCERGHNLGKFVVRYV